MKRAFVGLLLAALLAGCKFTRVGTGPGGERVVGSGNVKTERRDVPDFERVEVSGAFNVEVECGKETGVEVEADDNLGRHQDGGEGERMRVTGRADEHVEDATAASQARPEGSVRAGAADYTERRLERRAEVASRERAVSARRAGRKPRHPNLRRRLVDARERNCARRWSLQRRRLGRRSTGTLDATVNGVDQ